MRLSTLSNQFSPKKAPVSESYNYLSFSDLIKPEEEEFRKKIAEFAQTVIKPTIDQYYEAGEFPAAMIPKIREFDLFGYFLKPPYGKGMSLMSKSLALTELARVDPGFSLLTMALYGLSLSTIEALGSEEQKAKYLPKMRTMELLCGWALTEFKGGSDVAQLSTTATPVNGGYRLNGEKLWVGMANKDMIIVWARNTKTGLAEGFIIDDNKSPGLKVNVIQHKLSMRIINNCHIIMNNVFVPAGNKLAKCEKGFGSVNDVLRVNRLYIPFIALGLCLESYDRAVDYAMNRKQFGVPIASFQLIQEKLAKMMGYTQAVMLMLWRVANLEDRGVSSKGINSDVKVYVTEKTRDVTRLGREIMGGNGILMDNYVMKALNDIEGLITGEGTNEICALVSGRDLTGISAFTVPYKK